MEMSKQAEGEQINSGSQVHTTDQATKTPPGMTE